MVEVKICSATINLSSPNCYIAKTVRKEMNDLQKVATKAVDKKSS